MTTKQVKEALRAGRFSSVGCYPLFFTTSDGGDLCHACVRKEWSNVCAAIRTNADDGWRVTAHGANWEDPRLFCDHCNKRIESAYAEDDAPTESTHDDHDD